MRHLLGDRHADWWFTLFLTGDGLKVDENESPKEILTKVGLIKDGANVSTDLGQWEMGWGYRTEKRFVQIYEKIEQISQFF